MEHLTGTYDLFLVLLSYVIAVLASYAAFDLGGRISTASGWERRLWLVGGAAALGLGIWAMHFIAMLAFRMPMQTTYDLELVLLSFVWAVGASAIALNTAAGHKPDTRKLLTGGLCMGIGVVAMHYTGMEAMQMDASITYSWFTVALSLLFAVTVSPVALRLTFSLRDDGTAHARLRRLGGALVMGAGISGMHYTGMAAAVFTPGMSAHHGERLSLNAPLLAYAIGLGTVLLLFLAMLTVLIDRRMGRSRDLLIESEEHFKSLFENHPDAIVSVDLNGRICAVNPQVEKLTGITPAEVIGRAVAELQTLQNKEELNAFYTASRGGISGKFETHLFPRSGSRKEVSVTAIPITVRGVVMGVYAVLQDVTENKRAMEQINHMAYHDELTGLPNRRYLIDRLRESGEAGQSLLILLDINRFKVINESIGTQLGDRLLVLMAQRIREFAPQNAVVARIGSDEFALQLAGGTSEREAAAEAGKLLALLQQPFELDARQLYLNFNMGYAWCDGVTEGGELLLKQAGTALTQSKKRGGGIQEYSERMEQATREKLELENDLRQALENHEFEVYYQPQVDMQGRMIGAEALLRWNHPLRGQISPAFFIPAAEESGLIKSIGTWVLQTACRHNREWQEKGFPHIPVSVNLSIRQFEQPDLVEIVEQVLQETGLAPSYLELEITESMAMNAEMAVQALHRLKRLGIRVSMDDFGTGYSSLSYLNQFPIDKLKIDRSFVREISNKANGGSIVATIVAMAHHLNLSVIAEGVETVEQLEFLRSQQCDQIQGYYYSPPLSLMDFENFWKDKA